MADIKITDLTELTGINVNSADLFEIVDFDVDTSKKVSVSGLTTYFNSNLSFATTAQGTLADSATQPGDNVSTLTNDAGYLISISGLNISLLTNDSGYLTTISGQNISLLTNDSGYLTSISGLNISLLTNDSGYLTGITGQSIKNLSDVLNGMTPSNGQVLTWNTSGGYWEAQTSPSGVTDHGALTGLADDDHTQYLLANGARQITGSQDFAASTSLTWNSVAILSDSAGTMTLSNIDALDATTEATIEAAIDTLSNLTSAPSLSITQSQISDLDHTDTNAIHDNVSNEINAITAKTTPASLDTFLIEDSAASHVKKKLTYGNLQSNLSITESQISDLGSYITASSTDTLTNKTINTASNTITIAEADISDLQSYLLDITGESIKDLSDVESTMTPTNGQVLTWNNTSGKWEAQTSPSGVTDHGALTGLTDDDHTQYVLASGARQITGSQDFAANTSLTWASTAILSDSAGTMTLSNIDAIDATTEATIESAIDTLPNLTSATSLSITESQISDLGAYLTDITGESIESLSDVTTMTKSNGDVLTWNSTGGYWDAVAPTTGVTDHGALTGLSDDDHTQYLLVNGTRAMTGSLDMGAFAITNVGNVDGRDVSADGTKLDGIESGATADQTGAEIKTAYEAEADTNAFTDALLSKLNGIEALADVTDATNVDAAGATMNTDSDVSGNTWVLDEGTLSSDSATKVPTQQSVKAYVDHLQTDRKTSNYTLVLGDKGKCIEMNVASANTLTIPPQSSVTWVGNEQIVVAQYGAGQTTITAGAGVTLRAPNGAKISAQYGSCTLKRIASDEWYVWGNLTT